MKYSQKTSGCLLLLCCVVFSATAQTLEVSNTEPKLDTEGNIVDAHDGRLIQFGDTFYWYGTTYGNTNGFTTRNYYSCYSSKDLKTWKNEGKLLPDQPEGVYYRPHVVYNRKTKLYVLWYNWYPKLWNGQFGVATSKSPSGPFLIKNDNVKMFRSDVGLGDFGLFVDEDGACYLSYNTIQDHQVSVERLTEDYMASTLENGGIIAEHMEAGTQFKHNKKYYLLTDHTCCFCNYGSGARVYVSDNPQSGYTLTTNINRYAGRPSYILNNAGNRGTIYETLYRKDDNFDAIEVHFKEASTFDRATIYQFTGNRPENCGDVSNPRVHLPIAMPEFELFRWTYDHWEPMEMDSTTVVASALQQKWELRFSPAQASRFKILPKLKNADLKEIYFNEVQFWGEDGNVNMNNMAASLYITGSDIPQKPIIPAQQSYVATLETEQGRQFIWIGDLWGSASDNVKGHDYQYWSEPLRFNADGTLRPLEWTDSWSIDFKK